MFQSDGGEKADPRADQAAVQQYKGFWGPWLPPGPVPSPPPPPPPAPPGPPMPPTPPAAGFQLRYGAGANASCATVASLARDAACVLGVCDGGSKWLAGASDPSDPSDPSGSSGSRGSSGSSGSLSAAQPGGLQNAAVRGRYGFMRHHPPAGTCAAGTSVQLGEAGEGDKIVAYVCCAGGGGHF